MAIPHRYLDRSRLDPRVGVGPSTIEGRGLFAMAPITAGEVIAQIGGRLHRDADLAGLGPSAHSSVAVDDGVNLVQADDDPLQFGNHSCDPNAWMADEIRIVARRDIRAGEEITIDYALQADTRPGRCPGHCGSSECRHLVSGADWRRTDLQARYAGHWSPFLERRIRRQHVR